MELYNFVCLFWVLVIVLVIVLHIIATLAMIDLIRHLNKIQCSTRYGEDLNTKRSSTVVSVNPQGSDDEKHLEGDKNHVTEVKVGADRHAADKSIRGRC